MIKSILYEMFKKSKVWITEKKLFYVKILKNIFHPNIY